MNFLQVYQIIKPEPISCSVLIQKITHHSANLLPGYLGYIEVPATNVKPLHYKNKDVNSLNHTIIHSYYSDISEPQPPARRSSLLKTIIEINKLQPSEFLNRSHSIFRHIGSTPSDKSIYGTTF